MTILNNLRVVLVEPTHPGNIGGAARAMKNMGLSSLYLVSPKVYPHADATVRASGADDVLANITVCDSLAEAIADCDWVFGTSARQRRLEVPLVTAREAASEIVQADASRQIALLFGRESSGLKNEELSLCHHHVHIPCNEGFSSLNLAAAVQVMSYELRQAHLQQASPESAVSDNSRQDLANSEEMSSFLGHLSSCLTQLRVLDPNHPKKPMRRLQRLFNRAEPDRTEINILRGILSAIEKQK